MLRTWLDMITLSCGDITNNSYIEISYSQYISENEGKFSTFCINHFLLEFP